MIEFTGERVIPGKVETDLWNEHVARYAFAALFSPGKRVLDAGCGSGYGAAALSRDARSVTGVDISLEAVQYARTQDPAARLRLAAASATALPFADGAFDLVTAFEVIEHLEDQAGLIREARRVLAPGGVLLVSTPNREYYAESRGEKGQNPFHVREFTAAEFQSELETAFPAVRIVLQNRSEAFVFYPAKTFSAASGRIESSGGDASQAHFFIGVCSDAPLAGLPSFVYVPRAANVLREREQHIAKLQAELELNARWLEETRGERGELLIALAAQKDHLEQQNRWALGIEQEWKAAQQRIVELQDAYAADSRHYAERLAELEAENNAKTEWALETERRLSAEVENFRGQLGRAVALLDASDAELDERTRWALELQSKWEQAEAQLSAVRASRWVRAGRVFGAGPRV